jgi:hypothetical protein
VPEALHEKDILRFRMLADPRISPDGSQAGGDARRVASLPRGAVDFAWSLDGVG